MKIFTKKFFLLAIGMILSVGASAQTPTGAWEAYENDGITHANPTVLYKKGSDPNNPIYIIPAWDKRLYPHDSSSYVYLRARKITADGSKGAIVTAMGLLYDENGVSGFNGQFTAPLQVWCEKDGGKWLDVDAELMNSLTYADLFEGGQSAVCVFKDSKNDDPNKPQIKDGKLVLVHQITETNHTIPTSVAWNGGGTGTITELGPCAYGNATFSDPTASNNKFCRSAFKNLTIPNTITKIGEYAFRGINTLQKVTIEDGGTLSAIPHNCFEACRYLTNATLPSSINYLGGAAFGGCSRLNRLVFTSEAAPTFDTYSGKDPFQKVLTSSDVSELSASKCVIEVPLGTVKNFISADGQPTLLATKKFPLCSKFPLETSSGVMTYCSEVDFTFKQYNTSSTSWVAGEMKTYYVKGEDVEVGNGKVTLTEVTKNVMIPGWAEDNDFGVVLKGTSGTTYDIFYPNGRGMTTALTVEGTENCLKGCVVATPVNAYDENNSYFILSGGVFKRIMTNGQCKANRAYIKISGGADIVSPLESGASQALELSFLSDDTTGITTHEVQKAQNDAWYTLQGTQVNQPIKGIYIKNGKKFVIK